MQKFSVDGGFDLEWGGEGGDLGQFRNPTGIAISPSGLVYVADTGNHRIQIFNVAGRYLGSFGAKGSSEGQFKAPGGVALDSSGLLYVTDTGNRRVQVFDADTLFLDSGLLYMYVTDTGNRRVQVFDADRLFLRKWGAGEGIFRAPQGIAVSSIGAVYVADTGNHRIQQFDRDGDFGSQWGSLGEGEGQLRNPRGIAVDTDGFVYVADTGNDRVQMFDSDGDFVLEWGGRGSDKGQFREPSGIVVDTERRVWVTDTGNDRVQMFDFAGNFVLEWGTEGSGEGEFKEPRGIAVDTRFGLVYVADTGNHRIQMFNTAGVFFAESGTEGSGQGQFSEPRGIMVRGFWIYVADTGNHRVQSFGTRYSPVGKFVGDWTDVYSAFEKPSGIAGSLVVDAGNHAVWVFQTGACFFKYGALNLLPSVAVANQLVFIWGAGATISSSITVGGEVVPPFYERDSLAFRVPITSTTTSAGCYEVKATDNNGRQGAGTLGIPGRTLTVDPVESGGGSTVAVTGTGYPASSTVTVTYLSATVAKVTADSVGNFSTVFAVPMDATSPSTNTVTATSGESGNPGATTSHKVP